MSDLSVRMFQKSDFSHFFTAISVIVTTQFTTLAPASETGNNIFISVLQIRLKIVTFASASK